VKVYAKRIEENPTAAGSLPQHKKNFDEIAWSGLRPGPMSKIKLLNSMNAKYDTI
jgi:hypothetical protein